MSGAGRRRHPRFARSRREAAHEASSKGWFSIGVSNRHRRLDTNAPHAEADAQAPYVCWAGLGKL